MPEAIDESTTLTDEEIETRRTAPAQGATLATGTGDDSGDVSDTGDDSGDDSGDVSDTSDSGDDAGDDSGDAG
jgi:hypothetical protein